MKKTGLGKELISVHFIINEHDVDKSEEVYAEAWVYYIEDYNYGADADGGRGSKVVDIEAVNDLMIFDLDGHQIIATDQQMQQAREEICRKFLMG